MTIHCGDDVYESIEEMIADFRSRATWLERAAYATWYPGRRKAKDAQRAVKFAYQRVVRGWDDRAVWNIDNHLSRTLGQQLVTMATIAHGYPGDQYPYDRWTADLEAHGKALLAYQRHQFDVYGDERDAIYRKAQEALVWVSENLGSLWD